MLDFLFNILHGLLLIKIAFLVLNGIYVIFLIVVYKQSRAMQRVVDDSQTSFLLNNVALFDIIVGISLFVAALMIL